MAWTTVWTSVASWHWGDIAAWVGAAVNLGVVLVALSPIRTTKRERATRSRLVAAYLAFPMSLTCAVLKRGRKDLALLLNSGADEREQDKALKRFSEIPELTRGPLSRFDISEAAYLGDRMGEKLAQSLSLANAAVMAVPSVIKVCTSVRTLRADGKIQEHQAHIEQMREVSDHVQAIFDGAIVSLGGFADYCRGLGVLGKVKVPGE